MYQEPLPDKNIRIKTSNVCAVCGKPAQIAYCINPGKQTKSSVGTQTTTGAVWAKLCDSCAKKRHDAIVAAEQKKPEAKQEKLFGE